MTRVLDNHDRWPGPSSQPDPAFPIEVPPAPGEVPPPCPEFAPPPEGSPDGPPGPECPPPENTHRAGWP
jgi:hypothetical protein